MLTMQNVTPAYILAISSSTKHQGRLMQPTLETILSYLGMASCIGAAGYLFFKGDKTVAALLVAGFILHLQAALYMEFVDSSVSEVACWLEKSFYECLPLGQKISIHAAQLGHYLIAFGVFLLARAARRNDHIQGQMK